jgi:hypothetical protein
MIKYVCSNAFGGYRKGADGYAIDATGHGVLCGQDGYGGSYGWWVGSYVWIVHGFCMWSFLDMELFATTC